MKKYFLLIPILFSLNLSAQNDESALDDKLFVAYIAAGFNAAQIGGDLIVGYNKYGVNAGVGTYIMYNQKFSNSIEIAYSMRGARSTLVNKTPSDFKNYSTDYVSIPLLFNFHDKRTAIFSAGFTTSRLIRNNFLVDESEVVIDIKNFDFAFTAAITFLIKEKIGLGGLVNLSLTNNVRSPFTNPRTPNADCPNPNQAQCSQARNGGWFHNVLSFRMFYIFW